MSSSLTLATVITGASSGIGEALTIAFAKRGARIILSGRDKEKLAAVKSRCKNSKKHIVIPFDITRHPHRSHLPRLGTARRHQQPDNRHCCSGLVRRYPDQ